MSEWFVLLAFCLSTIYNYFTHEVNIEVVNKMLITGYHGTTESCANNILAEGKYHISCSDKEWLGNGIYFYEQFSDAYNWTEKTGEIKAVLHSVIKIEGREYLDIDSPEGKNAWKGILEYICEVEKIKLTGTAQENQCVACRMLWETNPDILVLAGSFASVPSKAKVLIDARPYRREFCVRNNKPIKCTQLINYKE